MNSAHNGAEDIVEVVKDTAGHLAHGAHLFCPHELIAQVLLRLIENALQPRMPETACHLTGHQRNERNLIVRKHSGAIRADDKQADAIVGLVQRGDELPQCRRLMIAESNAVRSRATVSNQLDVAGTNERPDCFIVTGHMKPIFDGRQTAVARYQWDEFIVFTPLKEDRV
ncbi:MAG: hypothetical protein Kow0074_07300 [Candidatus Zixiibacteriota bacterium]